MFFLPVRAVSTVLELKSNICLKSALGSDWVLNQCMGIIISGGVFYEHRSVLICYLTVRVSIN